MERESVKEIYFDSQEENDGSKSVSMFYLHSCN